MPKKSIASATIFGDVGCDFVNDRKFELSEILVQFISDCCIELLIAFLECLAWVCLN